MVEPGLYTANRVIETKLDDRLAKLEAELGGDVLVFVDYLIYGADDAIRDAVELLKDRKSTLYVVLETQGGYVEVVQRIVDTLRHHYGKVAFIIPNFAFSAGTVLAMSGDTIYMDYYSVLGPIDPQVRRPGADSMVPALGYLEQYDRLIKKSKKQQLTTAELTFLVQKFDPGELYDYEQQRALSITLLKDWLVRYKFKNWKRTQTKKKRVTKLMRARRATDIAKCLNDTKRWHSHGRGISMEVLRKDVGIQIEDYGNDPKLNTSIREYYKLLKDYMMRLGQRGIIHTRERYRVP